MFIVKLHHLNNNNRGVFERMGYIDMFLAAIPTGNIFEDALILLRTLAGFPGTAMNSGQWALIAFSSCQTMSGKDMHV